MLFYYVCVCVCVMHRYIFVYTLIFEPSTSQAELVSNLAEEEARAAVFEIPFGLRSEACKGMPVGKWQGMTWVERHQYLLSYQQQQQGSWLPRFFRTVIGAGGDASRRS